MFRHALVVIGIAGVASAGPKLPQSKVTLGTAVVTGSRDRTPTSIAAVVRKSYRKLVQCHAQAERLEGIVTVTFSIDGKGAVSAVSATGFETSVETCVAKVFGAMKFGKGKDAVDVSFPLTYEGPFHDESNVYGGLIEESHDGVGLVSGSSTDGSGVGWGTIGTGHYGTIGKNTRTAPGYGISDGNATMRARKASIPTLTLGTPTVEGKLDTAIVRRYVKRNVQKLTYCYEKQLLVDDKLAGTVTAEWTITEKGLVENATAHGVDPTIETCVVDTLTTIEFPKPKTGSVHVRWPLAYAWPK